MAKKNKRAKVPKRVLGVKLPKPLRRTVRPVADFLDTDMGRGLVVDMAVALAVGFASTETMRASFRNAAKRARKSGGGLADLALHLGRAALLPTLVALHAKLPDELRATQGAQQRAENERRSAEAVH